MDVIVLPYYFLRLQNVIITNVQGTFHCSKEATKLKSSIILPKMAIINTTICVLTDFFPCKCMFKSMIFFNTKDIIPHRILYVFFHLNLSCLFLFITLQKHHIMYMYHNVAIFPL